MHQHWIVKEKNKKALWENFQEQPLKEGEVRLDLHYSSINYKDALALCGKPGVVRKFPLTLGIDMAGIVKESQHKDFTKGEEVFATGLGLGEDKNGGLSTSQIIDGNFLLPINKNLTMKKTMQAGTAGFTAALCMMELLHMNITPKDGPLYVTGAQGGVGTFAMILASQLGFEIVALSRNPNEKYLKEKGASQILSLEEFGIADKPLAKAEIAAAIDTLGGDILSTLLTRIKPYGAVASCGLAQASHLHTSVMPFILRNIRLLGVSAVFQPMEQRLKAWEMISQLDFSLIEKDIKEIPLHQAQEKAEKILQAQHRGRYITSNLID